MPNEVPWDEIARAWKDPNNKIAAIAAEYGLTLAELKRAAAEHNWIKRGTLRRVRTSKRAKASPRPASKRSAVVSKVAAPAVKPLGLVKRIYNTIDNELSKLEAHKGASSQDRERASRALSQMVGSLEKAVEMQREIAKDAGSRKTSGGDKEALKDAEDLRREIADRIERLQRKRAAAK